MGIDEATGEILAAVVTTNDFHDGEVLSDLLDLIEGEIEQVSADGAYDHRHCYDEIAERDAKAVIPPRKDAVIWQHGNCKAPAHPRDENPPLHPQTRTQKVEAGCQLSSAVFGRDDHVSAQSHLWWQIALPQV